MNEPPIHLGINVYCWDVQRQNLALTAALRPLVGKLAETLTPCHFWFDRHDARGPHVMAMLTVPEDAAESTERQLNQVLQHHFEVHAESGGIDLEEIEARHQAASRQPLCEVDRRDGLAPENTFVVFRQPAKGFPYLLTRHLDDELASRFWGQATELTFWCLDALEGDPGKSLTGLALLWLGAFDHALSRAMPGRETDFWCYFAFSLWPGLRHKLEEDRQGTLDAIHRSVGERNRAVFSKIWRDPQSSWSFDGLMAIFQQAHDPQKQHTWRLPRTLVHCTLKQLGMHQQQESPAVFFALHRALTASPGDPRGT